MDPRSEAVEGGEKSMEGTASGGSGGRDGNESHPERGAESDAPSTSAIAAAASAAEATAARDWKQVLSTMNDLILFKTKADALTWRDAFENMDIYLGRIGMTQADLDRMSIIHVAGTKGKGSTCAMVESILRNCGYTTGLYTSPHLIDIRERVRVNGAMVDKETFRSHLWACLDRFRAAATPEAGVPGYFRFLTLLALSIFSAKSTDVTILEVGIGGRLDATNLVRRPTVTGITSLGMDHMEMLGDTLGKIAKEKAGIMKKGRPAFSVQQEDEAAEVLKATASEVGVNLEFVKPLEEGLTNDDGSKPSISLGGAHMSVNAGLAVKLASEWERLSPPGRANPGSAARLAALARGVLPAEYAAGLAAVEWPGRSQVIHDDDHQDDDDDDDGAEEGGSGGARPPPPSASLPKGPSPPPPSARRRGKLSFFIDGAHTPESMVTCADWFAGEVGAATAAATAASESAAAVSSSPLGAGEGSGFRSPLLPSSPPPLTSPTPLVAASSTAPLEVRRVLLFNCMKERDPAVLLPALSRGLAARGVGFHHALFVPSESLYGVLPSSPPSSSSSAATPGAAGKAAYQVPSASFPKEGLNADGKASVQVLGATQPPGIKPLPDLSWQASMQHIWEREGLGAAVTFHTSSSSSSLPSSASATHVLPPLPQATSPPESGASSPAGSSWRSAVVPSLPVAIDWLRKCSRSGVDVQVLVSGSLYLVGDVLRLLGRVPK